MSEYEVMGVGRRRKRGVGVGGKWTTEAKFFNCNIHEKRNEVYFDESADYIHVFQVNFVPLRDLLKGTVLMTMDNLVFLSEPPLASDDVASKTFLPRVFSINFYPRSQDHVFLGFFSEEIRGKNVFDATSSEANGGSERKTRLSIVISTLKNPETQLSYPVMDNAKSSGKTSKLGDNQDTKSCELCYRDLKIKVWIKRSYRNSRVLSCLPSIVFLSWCESGSSVGEKTAEMCPTCHVPCIGTARNENNQLLPIIVGFGPTAQLFARKYSVRFILVWSSPKIIESNYSEWLVDASKDLEAVCLRIEQWSAQSKNVDSLKLCDLGFFMVLMTMDILILHVEPPLAPDDVTHSPEGGERAGEIERAQREGRGHGGETRVDQKIGRTFKEIALHGTENQRKTVFDVTSSGANEGSTSKISIPIVISTLENPKSPSFRELIFFSCARSDRICGENFKFSYHRFLSKIELCQVVGNRPCSDCLRAQVRLIICEPKLDRLLNVTVPTWSYHVRLLVTVWGNPCSQSINNRGSYRNSLRFLTTPQVGIKHFPQVAIKLDFNLRNFLIP
ncbi:hypothetical protein PRIPAC_86321, partial [Pristionchus pacificus]|uniref:Uncharacterized protein n=1 Tax=Pristionchus pacificus TaxID=54126 RepID=A0A2A6BL09_PRIPA